jgi:hypothetical protein
MSSGVCLRGGRGLDDEVVAAAVAPGASDAEAAVNGGMEEGGFAEFSGELGVFAVLARELRGAR